MGRKQPVRPQGKARYFAGCEFGPGALPGGRAGLGIVTVALRLYGTFRQKRQLGCSVCIINGAPVLSAVGSVLSASTWLGARAAPGYAKVTCV